MEVKDVLEYFVSWTKAMRSLKMGVNTYQHWLKIGYIPMPAQIKIEKLTRGKLIADIHAKKES